MGGHRVTGVISARVLTATAPHVAEKITTIMAVHPAATTFEARIHESATDRLPRLERLFAEMAQWPDEVRSGPLKQFHRGTWHAIDIPFYAPGFKPAGIAGETTENLIWALQENYRIAADASAPASDRAVALCWIFHLVGDMHQPLHAASLYNAAFPDGDRFGTQSWIRAPHGGVAMSLHFLWDSAVQRSQKMADVEDTVLRLTDAHPRETIAELRARPFRGPDTFDLWTREESHLLAISAAYLEGQFTGAMDRNEAPRITQDYARNVHSIATRRMALAGYRLTEVLLAIFP